MDELIRTILSEWESKELPKIVKREIDLSSYFDLGVKKIVSLTGFRRVGKTYLFFDLIKELLIKKGFSRKEVVYINFEDERIPLKTEFLTALMPAIKEAYGALPRCLFLDEIQNIPNWSKWLRRVSDQYDMKIFVTGSSSKLSGHEIPTELRGRSLDIRIFPLNFREFLKFNDLEINLENINYDENKKAEIKFNFEKYLVWGGMPEAVLIGETKKFELIQSYYSSMLKKDIIERYDLKNEEALKKIGQLLVNSTMFSISKMHNFLGSAGVKVGKGTVSQYLSYFENSFFLYTVPIFSRKIKDQLQYPRKIYLIDNGFASAMNLNFSKNYGRLFENVVYINLKRNLKNSNQIFYWKSKADHEVDFILKENEGITKLIQACYDISSPETKEREVKALLKCAKKLDVNDLNIITNDFENTEKSGEFEIKYIPLWKWLLS